MTNNLITNTCFTPSYTTDLVCYRFGQFSDSDIDALFKLVGITNAVTKLKHGLIVYLDEDEPSREEWENFSDDFFELIVCLNANNITFIRFHD